jgi:uncharacterized membrane protein
MAPRFSSIARIAASVGTISLGTAAHADQADAPFLSRVAQSALTDIVYCNKTRLRAAAAVSYVEPSDNRFWTRGWVILEPGECRTMASTPNLTFYAYAETFDGSNVSWQGAHSLCVVWPTTFSIRVDGTTCAPGQETKPFLPIQAAGPGPHIWNLDPVPQR